MDFERTDKYMYSKIVEWDEVEIIEQKKCFHWKMENALECLVTARGRSGLIGVAAEI
jgi:hypothetical protein